MALMLLAFKDRCRLHKGCLRGGFDCTFKMMYIYALYFIANSVISNAVDTVISDILLHSDFSSFILFKYKAVVLFHGLFLQ